MTSSARPGLRFVDLQAQRRRLDGRIEAAIAGVLAHGQFILGPEVEQFEQALARYVGVRHAITCASGTDALLLSLMAQEIGPGDAVFVPGFTFAACAAAVALVGATPVLVDVEPASGNLDPASLGEAIEAVRKAGRLTPRAVLPVDLFGRPADYAVLGPIARTHGLFVLQDAAQSFGARWGEQPAGRQGNAAATSFYPAKPLGAYGDGGAVLTDDDRLAGAVRRLRSHGERARYDHVRIGLNSRLDTLQAAILLVKLEVLDEEIGRRGALAAGYDVALGDLVEPPPPPLAGGRSAWAQYTIQVSGRDRLAAALTRRGIPTAVHYPRPLHRQPAFAQFPTAPGGLPVAETLARRVLSLPIHPDLEPAGQAQIIAAIRELIEKGLDPDRRQDYIGGSARPPAG